MGEKEAIAITVSWINTFRGETVTQESRVPVVFLPLFFFPHLFSLQNETWKRWLFFFVYFILLACCKPSMKLTVGEMLNIRSGSCFRPELLIQLDWGNLKVLQLFQRKYFEITNKKCLALLIRLNCHWQTPDASFMEPQIQILPNCHSAFAKKSQKTANINRIKQIKPNKDSYSSFAPAYRSSLMFTEMLSPHNTSNQLTKNFPLHINIHF